MRLLATLVVLGGLLTGCGDGDEDTVLTVFAAASLSDVFEELAVGFESTHPGVDVRLVHGSSTTLAEQAADGAPADVLATADEQSMALAEDARAAEPLPFATNDLVLAVPRGNPSRITGVDDLAGATWVRCADDVPCGRAALAVLRAGRVDADPVSLEVDVRSVLAKVVSGEAEAGLVYRSDGVAAGRAVEVVEVPDAGEHLARYLAAPLDQAAHPGLAASFVERLGSPEGRRLLARAGFGPPEAPETPSPEARG